MTKKGRDTSNFNSLKNCVKVYIFDRLPLEISRVSFVIVDKTPKKLDNGLCSHI